MVTSSAINNAGSGINDFYRKSYFGSNDRRRCDGLFGAEKQECVEDGTDKQEAIEDVKDSPKPRKFSGILSIGGAFEGGLDEISEQTDDSGKKSK